jgi:WD40 repeat protein
MELSPENFGKSKSTEQTDRRENSPNITCLKYSYTGEDLLMSYNDDDIYLMNLAKNEVVQKYRGHRNMQTIKGVSFYGERSEFVVSGSDCGHFYIWDTKDGSLINSQVNVYSIFLKTLHIELR